MSLYDIAHERNRRLERADANISRCNECGAWQWKNVCTVNHDRAVVAYSTDEGETLEGDVFTQVRRRAG